MNWVNIDYSLFGIDRKKTKAGVGVFVVVGILVITAAVLQRIEIIDAATVSELTDSVTTVVILISILMTFIVSVIYALWNGGAVLAGALPVVAPLTGLVVNGNLTVTIDLAVGLSMGVLGAVLATYRQCQIVQGDGWSHRSVANGMAIATGMTVIAAAAMYSVQYGPHIGAAYYTAIMVISGAMIGIVVAWWKMLF